MVRPYIKHRDLWRVGVQTCASREVTTVLSVVLTHTLVGGAVFPVALRYLPEAPAEVRPFLESMRVASSGVGAESPWTIWCNEP